MATYSGSDKRIKYLFENGGGGGSSSLAGLSDVNLSSPTDGQVLTYDNGEWVNAAGGSGGSGGAVYTETELWSNSSGATAGTVTLSDNISHYDMLVFETSNSGIDETVHSQVVVPVSMIDTTGTNAFGASNVGGGENYVQLFRYVSDTSISLAWWTGSAPLKYYKIIGIKIVGGGISYSTNEQVVGTWVDGSTLYERTYFLDNISSSATEYVVDNSFGNNKTMHSMDVQFSGIANTLGKYINSISDTLFVDSGVLKYYIYKTGSWWNALNSCYITIRYTKSS